MRRTKSKAIVISSGNIPPFHIFFSAPEYYAEPDTRPRFRLLFETSCLRDLVHRHDRSTSKPRVRQHQLFTVTFDKYVTIY